MDEWKCAKCGCAYCWSEPIMVKGRPYCDPCSDSPVPEATTNNPGTLPWCLLCFFLGVLAGKWFFT